MQKMGTCLWFGGRAEEAANFYLSVFENGKIINISRYSSEAAEFNDLPDGSVLAVDFEMNGQKFIAMNAKPLFTFNEAISLVVLCETQEEIDKYWKRLTSGGKESQCGWLKDKFGVSWQVTPSILGNMLSDKDPEKRRRVTNAFMQMKKFDIAKLHQAFNETK